MTRFALDFQHIKVKDRKTQKEEVVGYRLSPQAVKQLAIALYLKYSKEGKDRKSTNPHVKFDENGNLIDIGRIKLGFDARIVNGTFSTLTSPPVSPKYGISSLLHRIFQLLMWCSRQDSNSNFAGVPGLRYHPTG